MAQRACEIPPDPILARIEPGGSTKRVSGLAPSPFRGERFAIIAPPAPVVGSRGTEHSPCFGGGFEVAGRVGRFSSRLPKREIRDARARRPARGLQRLRCASAVDE